MNKLTHAHCEICTAESPKVTEQEQKKLMACIPDWTIITHNSVMQLERSYQFTNFVNALTFTNKIGEIAEGSKHHPEIITEWGKVTVRWWTHSIQGLHKNDFIMAAKSDFEYSG